MKCSKCFSEIAEGAKFCNNCGQVLSVDTSSVAESSAPGFKRAGMVGGKGIEGEIPKTAGPAMKVPHTVNNAYNVSSSREEDAKSVSFSEVNTYSPIPEKVEKKPKAPNPRKKLMIILYILILVLAIVLGALVGLLNAKGKLNFFSNKPVTTEKKDDFHWTAPDEKIVVGGENAETEETVETELPE